MNYIERVKAAASGVKVEWSHVRSAFHGAHIDQAVLNPKRQFVIIFGLGLCLGALAAIYAIV